MSEQICLIKIGLLRQNFEHLEVYLEELEQKPLVILLTETWTGNDNQTGAFTLSTYNHIESCRSILIRQVEINKHD